MPERLGPADAAYLYRDSPGAPTHVGTVSVFETPTQGFDHDRLVQLIRQRIPYVPRYRKRIRQVPLGLARPVWVDDSHFDVTYHVRRSALPRPGSRRQLNELVSRLMSRPLDHERPLWEMYLIEGLDDGCFAIVTKTHQALVDGLVALDISQVLMDDTDVAASHFSTDPWRPAPEPSDLELLTAALSEPLARPQEMVARVWQGGEQVVGAFSDLGRRGWQALSTAAEVARGAGHGSLSRPIGAQRRFVTVDLPLSDFQFVHRQLGGTVNDVILTVVAGALRSWLTGRGDVVEPTTCIRALIPISTADDPVSAFLVDLPIGEPDPIVRLRRISFESTRYNNSAGSVGAQAIIGMAGFGPATLHALSARLVTRLSSRMYALAITNVPGPQQPLYASGCRLRASYPVMPLGQNQALSIGLTSYDGGVHFGLNADRDSMADIEDFAVALDSARGELCSLAEQGKSRFQLITGSQ
ncbi:MAG: WS/DGAT/MGAT family O-acyltransferase [Actinomycetales bacterium]